MKKKITAGFMATVFLAASLGNSALASGMDEAVEVLPEPVAIESDEAIIIGEEETLAIETEIVETETAMSEQQEISTETTTDVEVTESETITVETETEEIKQSENQVVLPDETEDVILIEPDTEIPTEAFNTEEIETETAATDGQTEEITESEMDTEAPEIITEENSTESEQKATESPVVIIEDETDGETEEFQAEQVTDLETGILFEITGQPEGNEKGTAAAIRKLTSQESQEISLADTENVIIPEKIVLGGVEYEVTEIRDDFFEEGYALKNIVIPDTVIQIGETVFDGIEEFVLYCNAGSYAESYGIQRMMEVKTDGIQIVSSEEVGTMTVDQSVELSVELPEFLPDTEEVEWSTSNPAVAGIDTQGVLTALAVGNVEINVKASGLCGKWNVEIVEETIEEETEESSEEVFEEEVPEGYVVPDLEDWEYEIGEYSDENTGEYLEEAILITRYVGDDDNIYVPESYEGVPVILKGLDGSIWIGRDDGIFEYTDIVNICFDKNIIIENMNWMFYDCFYLESVTNIPEYITEMSETFSSCRSLIAAPEIPDSVIDMSGTFSDCSNLTAASKIPDSVTNMDYTFSGCSSLTAAPEIPDSVIDMSGTFSDCSSLTAAPEIPDSVIDMDSTFWNCSRLIAAPEIPDSVIDMDSTFYGCSNLTAAPEIPDSVIDMDSTFLGCSSLTAAPEIPDSVMYMDSTFFCCSRLIAAPEIPDSVIDMDSTFLGCSSLTAAPEIPDSVIDMSGTFSDCSNLTAAPKIPDSVTNMDYTFSGCSSLTAAPEIPDSVIDMSGTFSDCSSLTAAPEIPDSVTNMDHTFSGCSSLAAAPEIPDSVIKMYSTFYDCTALSGILNFYACPEEEWVYEDFLSNAAINDTGLTINYTAKNEHIVDYIIAHKTEGSNITKGKQILDLSQLEGETISSDQYLIAVYDETNQPIQDATITFGDQEAKTDSRGTVRLSFSEEPGILRIQKEGYQTKEIPDYQMDAFTHMEVFTLSRGTFKFDSVLLRVDDLGTTYDLLKESYTVNSSDGDRVYPRLTAKVLDESALPETAEWELKQGKTVIAKTTGKKGIFYNLEATAFQPDKQVSLTATYTDDNGKNHTYTEKLNLTIGYDPFDISYVEFGESIKVTVPDSVPFLGGREIALNMPLLPVTYEESGDKRKIGINFDIKNYSSDQEDEEEEKEEKEKGGTSFWNEIISSGKKFEGDLKKFNKKFEELRKKVKAKEFTVSDNSFCKIKVSAIGYLEMPKVCTRDTLIEGSIILQFSFSVGTEKQFVVVVVPVVVGVEGDAKIPVEGKLVLQMIDGKWNIKPEQIALNPEIGLTGFGGVGILGSSIDIYGTGKTKLDLEFSGAFSGLKKWTLSGNLGLRVRLLGKVLGSVAIFGKQGKEYVVYEAKQKNQTRQYSEEVSWEEQVEEQLEELFEAGLLEQFDRDYLNSRTEWNGTVSENTAQKLQGSVYPDIQPEIVYCGDQAVMVYIDDAGNGRTAENRSQLVYSLYDKAAGNWSEPKAVWEDGTADYDPVLYSDGTSVYIVWKNAKEALSGDLTLQELGAKLELAVSVLNPSTGECESLGMVTDNQIHEQTPSVSVSGSQIEVFWYENSENDLLGTSGEMSFHSAIYENGTWNLREAKSSSEIIYGTKSGRIGEHLCRISLEAPADGDFTFDSAKLYIEAADGERRLLDENVSDLGSFGKVHGEDAYVWLKGNTLYYITSTEETPQILTEITGTADNNYKFLYDSDGNMAVLYVSYGEEESCLMVKQYDLKNAVWGNPIQTAAPNGKYVERISGTFVDGNLLLVYNETELKDTDSYQGTSDLYSVLLGEKKGLEISSILFAPEEIRTGTSTEISFTCLNSGNTSIQHPYIGIFDQQGNLIASQESDMILTAGSETDMAISMEIPELSGKTDFYLRMMEDDIGGTILAEESFALGQAYLVLGAQKNFQNGVPYLQVTVKNNGYSSAGGILSFYDAQNEEQIYLEQEMEALNAGEVKNIRIPLDNLLKQDAESHMIGIRLESEEELLNLAWPMDFVVVSPLSKNTVSFVTNAEFEVPEQNILEGEAAEAPELPEREGYEFLGWYTNAELTNEWDFAEKVTEDMTLYARWEHFHIYGDAVVTEATCVTDGKIVSHCKICGAEKMESIPATGQHQYGVWITSVNATCVKEGVQTRSCVVCGQKETKNVPATGQHFFGSWTTKTEATCTENEELVRSCTLCGKTETTKGKDAKGHQYIYVTDQEANCGEDGIRHEECAVCHEKKESEVIPATGKHSFGSFKITKQPTAILSGEKTRTCTVCGKKDYEKMDKLKAFIKVNAKTIPLKVRQSTKAIKVTYEKGDKIVSWKSSNKKIATVSKGKITGKKVGTATITVTLKSGEKAKIKVKVQKKPVTTTRLRVSNKNMTLKVRKKRKLAAIVTPITSTQKITYTSMNKKIATVSKTGMVTAKRKGKVKIVVKSGKKRVVCTIKVIK